MTPKLWLVVALVAVSYGATACADAASTEPAGLDSGSVAESAGTASIIVSATTTGEYRAFDNYVVFVDRTPRGSIAPNGQLVVQSLIPSAHIVSLSGVPADCAETDSVRRIVRSPPRSVRAAHFSVFCGTAAIRVSTKTVFFGTPFGDGYSVRLDGGVRKHIDRDGSVVFSDVNAGVHVITLADLPTGCGVSGFGSLFGSVKTATQSVVLGTKDGVNVTFYLTCIA